MKQIARFKILCKQQAKLKKPTKGNSSNNNIPYFKKQNIDLDIPYEIPNRFKLDMLFKKLPRKACNNSNKMQNIFNFLAHSTQRFNCNGLFFSPIKSSNTIMWGFFSLWGKAHVMQSRAEWRRDEWSIVSAAVAVAVCVCHIFVKWIFFNVCLCCKAFTPLPPKPWQTPCHSPTDTSTCFYNISACEWTSVCVSVCVTGLKVKCGRQAVVVLRLLLLWLPLLLLLLLLLCCCCGSQWGIPSPLSRTGHIE